MALYITCPAPFADPRGSGRSKRRLAFRRRLEPSEQPARVADPGRVHSYRETSWESGPRPCATRRVPCGAWHVARGAWRGRVYPAREEGAAPPFCCGLDTHLIQQKTTGIHLPPTIAEAHFLCRKRFIRSNSSDAAVKNALFCPSTKPNLPHRIYFSRGSSWNEGRVSSAPSFFSSRAMLRGILLQVTR